MRGKVADASLKRQLTAKARSYGIELVGFAPVERWADYGEIPERYFPQHVFPHTRTVVVMAAPVFIPMLDTTPSIVYAELYATTNRLLDRAAYMVSLYLNRKGFRGVFFPRDGYGDISVLIDKPQAAFSHVVAGKYAGLGTIGYNHTLLTKAYGPRVRLVSVFTDAPVAPDAVCAEDLCIKCMLCRKCCPTSAFASPGKPVADMDKHKCAAYHAELKAAYRYPCGVCIKVCPVGEDRKLYGMDKRKYVNEKDMSQHPGAYADWIHIRSHGSK